MAIIITIYGNVKILPNYCNFVLSIRHAKSCIFSLGFKSIYLFLLGCMVLVECSGWDKMPVLLCVFPPTRMINLGSLFLYLSPQLFSTATEPSGSGCCPTQNGLSTFCFSWSDTGCIGSSSYTCMLFCCDIQVAVFVMYQLLDPYVE